MFLTALVMRGDYGEAASVSTARRTGNEGRCPQAKELLSLKREEIGIQAATQTSSEDCSVKRKPQEDACGVYKVLRVTGTGMME